MKKLYIIIALCLLANSSFAQDYIKTLKNNNRWNILLGGCTINGSCSFRTHSITIGGDSTISDTNYKKLMSELYATDTSTIFAGLIREDTITKKVYFRKPDAKEHLIYDYSLKENDTINENLYDAAVVINVDSVEINGEFRKRVIMDYINHGLDTIIEGIGSISRGLIELSHIDIDPYPNEGLRCFWESGTLIYENYNRPEGGSGDIENCFYSYITSIKDRSKNNSNLIIPNPARKIITVKSPKLIEYFSLYNISGKKIKEGNPYAKHLEIPVHELKAGYYILQINDNSQKIMIE